MANSITRDLIIEEANRRGWQVATFGRQDYLYQITDDRGRSELFRGGRPLRSSANGFIISKYKDLTLQYAEFLGYRMPGYMRLTADEQVTSDFLARYQKVVVKPMDAQQSEGVTTGIVSNDQLQAALATARLLSPTGQVMVQEQLFGNLYRLLVINGKFVAGALRQPAEVIGDGQSTVSELIEQLNADPRRGTASDTPLKKVKIADAENYLGLEKLAQVLPISERLRVAALESISAGGEAANVTSSVHESWRQACQELTTRAGLFICGFDVMCADISQPVQGNYLPLLEMNSLPGFKLHQYPTAGGEPINLAPILLDELFK